MFTNKKLKNRITALSTISGLLIDIIKIYIRKEETSAICGYWTCLDENYDPLIIEKIAGKYRATLFNDSGDVETYPIYQEGDNLILETKEKKHLIVYHSLSDTIEINQTYQRKSKLLTWQSEPFIVEPFK